MSGSRGIWKNFLAAMLLLLYIVVSIVIVNDNRSQMRCIALRVEVLDSALIGFVTPRCVDSLIASQSIVGRNINDIDLFEIENIVSTHPYVAWCDVFSNIKGVVTIKLTQREPVLRVMSEPGHDFYVDTSLCVLKPDPNYQKHVPIVSGYPALNFPPSFYGTLDQKNSLPDIDYIKKLINFVKSIQADDFLRDFVMQVYVGKDGNVELMPRIGAQVVLMGSFDDFETKLLKTKAFYMQCYGSSALDTVRIVDVRYSGQIITRGGKDRGESEIGGE